MRSIAHTHTHTASGCSTSRLRFLHSWLSSSLTDRWRRWRYLCRVTFVDSFSRLIVLLAWMMDWLIDYLQAFLSITFDLLSIKTRISFTWTALWQTWLLWTWEWELGCTRVRSHAGWWESADGSTTCGVRTLSLLVSRRRPDSQGLFSF